VSHRAATGRARTAGPLAFLGPGPGPLAAWIGDTGALRVASLATGRQRVVARTRADPSVPLVVAGGRLYWVDTSGFYSQVRDVGQRRAQPEPGHREDQRDRARAGPCRLR